MQASLAIVGSLLALASWWIGKDAAWLLGGILLFAVIPFTLVVIFPTSKEVESDKLDVSSARRNGFCAAGAPSTRSAVAESSGFCDISVRTPAEIILGQSCDFKLMGLSRPSSANRYDFDYSTYLAGVVSNCFLCSLEQK